VAVDRASGLPGWVLAPLAAAGGLAASASFAPLSWWPLAFVAVAVLAWAVGRSNGPLTSLGLGWAFGLAFMGTSLVWQTSILVLSYAGLTLVTSLLYAAVGGALHLVSGLRAAPLWGAAVWSLGESVLAAWPFDGFGWMRLGYTQVESPLAGFYPFAGAAFVTFLVALIGHVLARAVEAPGRRRAATAAVVAAALLGLGGLGTRWDPEPTASGTVSVGWVQGGAPGGGVYGLGPARTITFNQRDQTFALMAEVDAGRLPRPDLVVWPENSTDMDPRRDAATRSAVEASVARAGVPILVGAIHDDPEREERQTVAVWWTPQDGPGATYAKRNLVPFGEWIPLRALLLPLIPELAYVGYQSVPGATSGSLDVELADGRSLDVGVAICYEVIYPRTLHEATRDGAGLFVVQSSNAMYQDTNQIDQQFAITRVRAAEMRKEVLVVTTSGLSGRIGRTGGVEWTAPVHVGAHGVETMTVANQTTPAMVWGGPAEALVAGLAVVGLALGSFARTRGAAGGTMAGARSIRARAQ